MNKQRLDLSEIGNLLVIAPPGCGKTELLARRAAAIIPLLRPNQKILALTFSNKAKANLDNRLSGVLGIERKRRFVSVRNFHGHAAEIVRAHGKTAGINPAGPLPDKRTQTSAIDPFLEGFESNEYFAMRERIETDLRAAKGGPWSDTEVISRLAFSDPRSLQVERNRQRDGTYFYDDLLRHAQKLLRIPEIARLYQSHYAAVLVDEFQDLSPQQLDIGLRSASKFRTFVGDPMQGIYTWAGANPAFVELALRRISGAPFGLGISYRSSPAVLRVLAAAAKPLGGNLLDASDGGRWFEGGISAGGTFETAEAEAKFIFDASAEIVRRHPGDTIGIICRNGWRREQIDAVFTDSDLPSRRWDLTVDDPKIIEMLQNAAARLGEDPNPDALSVEARSGLDPADVDTASEIVDAIAKITEVIERSGSIASALNQLKASAKLSDAIEPGVHLLNAHTGKGQQFDWVFIPGFEHGNIPSYQAKTPSSIEEELRVLIVMLSRARHGVVVTRAERLVSRAGKQYAPKQSRWHATVRGALGGSISDFLAHIERS